MAKGKALRNTYLWGPVIQGMFLMTVTQTGVSEAEFYLYLFLLLVAWAFFYKLDNPRETILDTERYELSDAAPQIFMGVGAALVIAAPIIAFGRLGPLLSPYEAMFQILMVANVETLWMIMMIRLLPWGVYLWPFMFALAHPVVRLNWFAGSFPLESFVGFSFAFLMGIVFWMLWQAGTWMPSTWKVFFGPVTPWAAHAALNIVMSIFIFILWGLELVPM